MAAEKVLMIDGSTDAAGVPAALVDAMTGVLAESGSEVRTLSGDALKVSHCIGCFGCWLETPGICRFKEAAGQALLEAWVRSDTVILLTPVTFGGYSWRLKQAMDRTLPILLPYMALFHGEVHHRPRYAKQSRLLVVGVQDRPDAVEAETFRLLAGRHAVDCQAPSYAVEVVGADDGAERLRETFRALLRRTDAFPRGRAIRAGAAAEPAMGSAAGSAARAAAGAAFPLWSAPAPGRRACLIVGSPKTKSPSSSGVLGNYVLDVLRERGWETEGLTLTTAMFTPEGEAGLCAAVDRCDLLLLAFPLYIDALPALVTRAAERIAAHRRAAEGGTAGAGAEPGGAGGHRPQGLAVIVNNGFPESFQNNVALAICKNFAVAAGFEWMGGLALGAGESVIGGEPLAERSQLGFPLLKVHAALKTTADALDRGRPIPAEATDRLAAGPMPYTPFRAWRLLFLLGSRSHWEKGAASFGVDKKGLLARPFAAGAPAPAPRRRPVGLDAA